jgi:hypothetical protein
MELSEKDWKSQLDQLQSSYEEGKVLRKLIIIEDCSKYKILGIFRKPEKKFIT